MAKCSHSHFWSNYALLVVVPTLEKCERSLTCVCSLVSGVLSALGWSNDRLGSARPQERQHSNHPTTRVKWSADSDISESTDDIILGSSSVLAGDGLVSVTKVDNVHAYSNVNRILLLPNSNLLRSPSTPRRLLILPGLPKDAPFNQPIIRHPWLLALQQRLS